MFLPSSGISTLTAVCDTAALRLVGLQQVLPGVAMQAALTEVLPYPVLTLIMEKAVEVFDPGIMKIVSFLNQR